MKPLVMAILGGTSHIAKSLIAEWNGDPGIIPVAFVRSESRMRDFSSFLTDPLEIRRFSEFESGQYDMIVNCVGAGTPDRLGNDYSRWFTLTEEFDSRIIHYLRQINSEALYINFSSGGVYGQGHESGVDQGTLFSTPVNHVPVEDYYSLVRLYHENKHRSMADLNIVDIRIFSWFTRFADPGAGYFMTEIMKSLKEGSIFKTSPEDMIRDYPSPRDLYKLICLCATRRTMNLSCDLYSAKPAGKFEILQSLQKDFGLQFEKDGSGQYHSPNGTRKCYYSRYKKAEEFGYDPSLTSLQTIHEEINSFLKGRENIV